MKIAYLLPILCVLHRIYFKPKSADGTLIFEGIVYIFTIFYFIFDQSAKVKRIYKSNLSFKPNENRKETIGQKTEQVFQEKTCVNDQDIVLDLKLGLRPRLKVLPAFSAIFVPEASKKILPLAQIEENFQGNNEKIRHIQTKLNEDLKSIDANTKKDLDEFKSSFFNRKKSIDNSQQNDKLLTQLNTDFNRILDDISTEISKVVINRVDEKRMSDLKQQQEIDEKEKQLKEKIEKDKQDLEKIYKLKQPVQKEAVQTQPIQQIVQSQHQIAPIPNREIPIIDPQNQNYQMEMQQLISDYKITCESSKNLLDQNIFGELNSVSNQIDAHRDNTNHIEKAINYSINFLARIPQDKIDLVLVQLCEKLVNRNKDMGSDIESGPLFALNLCDLMFRIAKTYPSIHKILFLSIVSKPKIMIPLFGMLTPAQIIDRVNLINTTSVQYANQMDECRSFGILLATYYTHSDSQCNIQDCWRWLSYVLNIPEEYIDRHYVSTIEGFLKVSGPYMRDKYKKQYAKIVDFLRSHYLDMIKQKFRVKSEHIAFITQLDFVIKKL